LRGKRSEAAQKIGLGAFGVGALAYLLKNRFYIGEVVYRSEIHRGDHAPILDRALFEAVQKKTCRPSRGTTLPAAGIVRAADRPPV
jgi:site-specific DNA recombinase